MRLIDLAAPFDPSAVHWRVQGKPYERNGSYSAMALAYLDARDVMDRLDEVCGPQGWQSHFDETPKGRVICRLSIKIGDEWVTKSDGAGDTDVEGEKGGISDALKRAAVSWGIGRYLYRLDSPWVACEVSKKSDNVYWKRWTEDPWRKVKGAVKAPEPPQSKTPEFDCRIVTDRILASIARMDNLDKLDWLYRDEKENIATLKAGSEPMHAELLTAFKARKATLAAMAQTADELAGAK